MAELMDYVGVMADQIGPRPVSTEEEHQTSLYIAQELTDDGLDVDVDEFATPTGTRWPYAIAFVLTIFGALISGVGIFVPSISLTMFVVGIVLIAAGVFIYYTEINNKPVLSKMRAGGVSQNVVARYVPSSVRREQRRRKVIVVAHVDTVRAELEAAPALIKYTALLRRIVYYTMIGIAAIAIVRLLPLPWPSVVDTVLWVISLIGCVYLLAATVCIVARRFTPYVSGGNDNASAGAVLLGVAKRIVDPEERERHRAQRKADAEAREAAEEAVAQERAEQAAAERQAAAAAAQQNVGQQPVEAEGAVEPTRAFTPVEAEAAAQQQPVVHDVQAAYAAGVVPDGAEIAYEQVAVASEKTTVIPPVADTNGVAQVQPTQEGAVAEQPLGATQVLSRDDLDEVLGKTTAIPQPTYPEIVEDPNAAQVQQPAQNVQPTQGVQPQAQQPEGYRPLPQALYAQTPADSVQAQVASEQPGQQQPQTQQPAVQQQPVAQPAQPAPVAQPAVQQPVPQQQAAQPQAPAPAAQQQAVSAQPAPQQPAQQAPASPAAEPARPQKREKTVPSWYKAAKEKAARDLEARNADEASDKSDSDKQPEGFRSRYAQIPVNGTMENVRRAMVQEEETAEEQGELKEPPAQQGQDADAPQNAPTAEQPAAVQQPEAAGAEPAVSDSVAGTDTAPSEPAVRPQQAAQPQAAAQQQPEHIDFSILGDDIDDDISPEMSGVFEAVEKPEVKPQVNDPNEIADNAQDAAEKRRRDLASIPTTVPQQAQQENSSRPQGTEPAPAEQEPVVAANERRGILKGLTSRIPIIGSSDEVQKTSAPVSDDVASANEVPAAQQGQPKQKAKPERRKPTARHITQEFQPTRPVDERENESENEKLSSMRQEVAVSSTYEATPQAGPDYDPFIPKDEQPYDAYGNATSPASSAPFPSLSNQGRPGSTGSFGNPGNSSSFPSLSGSFPSLSGQIPRVNPNDFGDSYDVDYGYEPTSEDVAEDFGNPNLTGEINIPDSRFHNAMDKVSGLFSHKDKKAKKSKKQKHSKHGKRGQQPEQGYDNFDDGNVDNWDEDDDFGWKGGAYVSEDDYGRGRDDDYGAADGYEPPVGSALEAAKARAHEIRDSVIEMTENDLLDKEVWFVALGASGAGNQGMKNFLELHGPELRGSLIINLEAVGAGTIHYVDFEGTGKSHRSDRRLQNLVRKASKTLDGVEMRPQKLEWRNTDATPAMAAGLRAMTIMGFDGPAPVAWHWSDDTSDIVNPDNLEYVTELVLEMIENS